MNIIDNYHLLTPSQDSLLRQCSSQPFFLNNYSSLDDLLTSLKVDVIIESGIISRIVPFALDDAEEYWRKEAERLESMIPDADDQETARNDYKNARRNIDDIRNEKESWSLMPLRGLYDPIANVIKLYPEEMIQEYGGLCMDELLISTLAHEIMHAYFNRPHHKSFPYVIHVEEPLAEFGMLLFLYETGSNYYNWAYQDVNRKKTCYRYGAMLMNQHLAQGSNSSYRRDLEAYKIKFVGYPMPTISANSVTMPRNRGRAHSPVQVGGVTIHPKWQDIFKYYPRYCYDAATKTLLLDGDWSDGMIHNRISKVDVHIMIHMNLHYSQTVSHIYLGDKFRTNHPRCLGDLLSSFDVVVSSANKEFTTHQGIPFIKKSNKPFLSECGNDLYEICRNGEWGVIDENLNQIVPFKYDYIWTFDKNDLAQVSIYDGHNHHYGLVNMKGQEQVAVIYDDIDDNPDGTYTVKYNGREFKIDKYGNRV